MARYNFSEVLVIDKSTPFVEKKYVLFTKPDGSSNLMLYNDAFEYLKKESFFSRYKTMDELLSKFHAKSMSYEEFSNTGRRFYDMQYEFSNVSRAKADSLRRVEGSFGIDMSVLTGMYWLTGGEGDKRTLMMYDKIKSLVLSECNRSGIKYREDKDVIIREAIDSINATSVFQKLDLNNYSSQERLEQEYQKRLQVAVADEHKFGVSFNMDQVVSDFESAHYCMTSYPGDMFTDSYQLLEALNNKNCINRENILRTWAEFLIVLKDYVALMDLVTEYSKRAYSDKVKLDKARLTGDATFMRDLTSLLEHNSEEVTYRFHATGSLNNGINIMNKGLFMGSTNLDSTSFVEFTIDDVMSYQYGSTFLKVGDYIVVFAEPKGEEIVRETTQEERDKNKITARRLGASQSFNGYVVEPKYIVGLVDRENQKIYFNPSYEKEKRNVVK